MSTEEEEKLPAIEHPAMDVDIAVAGFGPAAAGFLTTLSAQMTAGDGSPLFESPSAPGMPLQVICYERADDLGFGVSGVVTKAEAIRKTLPEMNLDEIPMATPVTSEKLVYLRDPIGASRRSPLLKVADAVLSILPGKHHAFELPYTPGFLNKHGGLVLSIGQFMQWAGSQVMATGNVQLWPSTPATAPLFEGEKVIGLRLIDQGVDKSGAPAEGFTPGMDIHAALTVAADGPVGAIGQQLDEHFGMPEGHEVNEWAVGMKFVVELSGDHGLKPGTVLHTFGYPEPEIFGFFYVHPENVASVGIFVPSSYPNPARTAYRYLQHYIQHPYLWRYLQGGRLLSWGAKSLQESGRRGEPVLAGDGFARIGEGSGTTNILTNSGVDEAWLSGSLLAEGVLELLRAGEPFTKENLEKAYVARRRASSLEKDGRQAERARDGFHKGLIPGMIGMALAAFTGGKLSVGSRPEAPHKVVQTIEEFFKGRIKASELAQARQKCQLNGQPMHDILMDLCGWPTIHYDGQLLITQQDALLMGGKVQASPGYADHVRFTDPRLCLQCERKVCVEICSGQAIAPGPDGVPVFDREKCVYCGACLWNCTQQREGHNNLRFGAGSGGFHSAEN